MEVILREDVPKLGRSGEVVVVRDGYARNYLLPRGLAVEANRRNLRVLEHHKRVIADQQERKRREAEAVAAKISGLELTVTARAGAEGKLFGSVTNLDIEKLLAAHGFAIDHRAILLEEPIKSLGTFEVPIALGREVRAAVRVSVTAATD